MTPPRPLLVLLALLAVLAAPGRAQDEPVPAVDPRFESPRATMFTFLEAINAVKDGDAARWPEAVACLDLSQAGAATVTKERRHALLLWGSLNRIRVVAPEQLPAAGDLEQDQDSFLYFPRPFDPDDDAIVARADIDPSRELIELARGADGRWLFSADTVAGLASLYDKLSVLDAKIGGDEWSIETEPWLRKLMPSVLVRGEFLQLEYWQWLGLLLLALLGKIVDQLVRHLARPLLRRVARRYHGEASDDAVDAVVRPLGLLASGLVWLLLVRTLGFGGAPLEVLLAAIGAFTILAGTWAAWSLTDLVGEVLTFRAGRTDSTIDDVLVPLLTKTVKVFIVAFGLVYAAQSLHFNVVPLITGLGIGGLAFAFAAKDTIENLFGSIAVILDRPFEVGDWVVIGDAEGTVEDLGFRSTRIRTFYNSQVTVPNAALVRAVVDNYGRRRYRRWKTTLGVQYDTTPEQLLAFTEGIRELIRTHPYTRKDYYQVWCNEFGASSLNVMLYMFFDVPDWTTELRERERLFIDVVRLADRLGVQFAFPTQTVHLFRGEEPDGPAHGLPAADTDDGARRRGLDTARELTRAQPWRDTPPGPVTFAGAEVQAEVEDPRESTEDTKVRKRPT